MIACVGPASRDYVETLSTLRYANRAKNIHNKPRVNEDPKDTMLRQYQEEISKLRKLLETRQPTPLKIEDLDNPEVILEASKKSNNRMVTEDINKNNHQLNAKRDKLIHDYEDEMAKLRSLHENEKTEKEQILHQIEAIKAEYQGNIEKLNAEVVEKNTTAKRVNKEEILQRIDALKAIMIGGERAGDKELSERRKKKKLASERRLSAIAHVLAKIDMNEDRELLQNQYKDISQELNLKTDALRKFRFKVRSLEKEISDIQSEFEAERQDYLETVRKQNMQTKLLSQISEKMAGTLKKECNYKDLEAIKDQAVWLEDAQKYKLPDLLVHRTKLPPAGNNSNRTPSSNSDVSQNESAPTSPPNYTNRTDVDELIGTYFKPKRAAELLNQSMRMDTSNVFNTWRDGAHITEFAAAKRKPRSTENISSQQTNAFILQRSPKTNNNNTNYWFEQQQPLRSRPLRLDALPSLEQERQQREIRRRNATSKTRVGVGDFG